MEYVKNFGEIFYEQAKLLIDRNQAKQNTYNTLDTDDAVLIQVNFVYFYKV